MILHKSEYVEVSYEQENSMLIEKFLPSTTNMTDDEFKKEMSIIYDMVDKKKPKIALINLLDMKYVIGLEMQEWMNKKILTAEVNFKKSAYIVPTELFAQVSVEQTMDEEVGQKIVKQYFENEDEARKWLLE